MPPILDTRRVRRSTPAQLRDYYAKLIAESAVEDVTKHLLIAIERESIAPTSFAPWLGVTKSASVIKAGLTQDFSVAITRLSIKAFSRALHSSQWKTTWDALGSNSGLLSIFANLSVNEVRLACKLLGRCGNTKEKRGKVGRLFEGLNPDVFPDAQDKTGDRRALKRCYGALVPSCEEELVRRIVEHELKGWKVRGRDIVRLHPDVMKRAKGDKDMFKALLGQYPNCAGSEPGMSASMEFSLQILRQMVQDGTPELDDDDFINDLVRPLLRRAVKKKLAWSRIQEIVDLTLRYLAKHPDVAKELSTTGGDVIYLVAQCWARKPELFETQLRTLCSHLGLDTAMDSDITAWEDFMTGTPRSKRYALLRLCFLESTGLDITKDPDLTQVKGSLSNQILENLPPHQALDLLTRLRTARGDEGLVTVYFERLLVDTTPTFEGTGADPDLYRVTLLNRDGRCDDASEVATRYVDVRKKKAAVSSTPEQRAYYAKKALYFAIASGSLELYASALGWTKRFLRDQAVLRELYPSFYPQEVVRLLSGVPECVRGLTTSGLRERVQSGNEILRNMFETACAAIHEPSFQWTDWCGTLRLFRLVVQERMDKTTKIKKLFAASDVMMLDVLWADTIEMLLNVEELANAEKNQRLEAQFVRGPLNCDFHASSVELRTAERSTYLFLDMLAKRREEFWEELRARTDPAVSALPAAFTRGLPVQHLIAPWVLDVADLEHMAPYISSRVQAVLFPDPNDALVLVPEDAESKTAIGVFVDSYNYALQLYIPPSCTKTEKTTRNTKVWDHATCPLSQSRMTSDETPHYWAEHRFKHFPTSKTTWPALPDPEDPEEPTEWNPNPLTYPERNLGKLTYLDLALTIHSSKVDLKLRTSLPYGGEVVVPAKEVTLETIWEDGELGVLSALMFLEKERGEMLLATPFPSKEDARYPAMYLSEEFEGCGMNKYHAAGSILGHVRNFPPALLHRVVKSVMGAEGPEAEVVMTLLVRLGESDNPVLAKDLVLEAVLEKTWASAWHRAVLSGKFWKRLGRQGAREVMEGFVAGVFERIEAMQARGEGGVGGENMSREMFEGEARQESNEGKKSEEKKSFVKVTTVKMLAELLRNTEFVDMDFAVDVLSKLLEKATHVDVRTSTVKSLLSMLSEAPSELADKILGALETIVPIVGNLNEREPITDDAWRRAEDTLDLPEYPDASDETSPTLNVLLQYYCKNSIDAERLEAFTARIILPSVNRLKEQSKQWTSLFLRKHGVVETASPVSGRHTILVTLLKSDTASSLTPHILSEYTAYLVFAIAPPTPIAALNARLRADSSLRSQPDVNTWLSLYGLGAEIDIFNILSLFTKATSDTPITPSFVQEQYLRLFKTLLPASAPLYTHLTTFLAPLLRGTYLLAPWWPASGAPLVASIIAHVNGLRTREWERDPKRMPSVLPDTFRLRLRLLAYPWRAGDDCALFARQLSQLVQEMGRGLGIYHGKLEMLQNYLQLNPLPAPPVSRTKRIGKSTVYYRPRDFAHEALARNRVEVALELGDVRDGRLSWVTRPEVLRVGVAGWWLGILDGEKMGKEVKEKVRARVEQWRESDSEEVRRTGWGVQGWMDEE